MSERRQLVSIYEICLDYAANEIDAETAMKDIMAVMTGRSRYFGKVARRADAIYLHNELTGSDSFRE